MTYFSPYIDATGLHIPTYNDILQKRIEDAKKIFGQDIYLGTDSADYQLISVESLGLYEALQAIQYSYNQMCPATSIGAGLSSLVQLNGLLRKSASYSTCDVLLTGNSAATITNGIVKDIAGNNWSLPSPITLVASGSPTGSFYSLTVTATCETIGAITSSIGDINSIVTPTAGWTDVENLVAATPGIAVESDSELRDRQAISVELPSETMLGGTEAAIANVSGVTRYKIYENPSSSTTYGDPDVPFEGAPTHSITCIVEGGTIADIAQAIYENRGNGCYMNGNVEQDIVDDYLNETTVRFYRPTYVDIYVDVEIQKLSGYVSSLETQMEDAIIDYINSLDISATVSPSSIIYALMALQSDQTKPVFSVSNLTIGKTESPLGSSNLSLEYNEVALGSASYISISIL